MKLATELQDRTLRWDGVSIIQSTDITKYLLLGVPADKLRVTEINDEVERFNMQVRTHDVLKVNGDEPISLGMAYQIPERYRQLDLLEYFGGCFETKAHRYSEDQQEQAFNRISDELMEVERRGMVEFLQTVIYILDTFREHDVVWGVGRGSSCACYLLYLAGLHLVDCIKLDIPMSEFFHD